MHRVKATLRGLLMYAIVFRGINVSNSKKTDIIIKATETIHRGAVSSKNIRIPIQERKKTSKILCSHFLRISKSHP